MMNYAKEFEKEPHYNKHKDIFNLLKRKFENFFKEIHFYDDVPKEEKLLIWLCDESSHHVDKFLKMIKSYHYVFNNLDNTHRLEKPIQQGNKETEDHIFGNISCIREVSENKNFYQKKFDKWKYSTKKGLINKIDNLLSYKLLDDKQREFLKINRDSLINFDDSTCVRWFRDFNYDIIW